MKYVVEFVEEPEDAYEKALQEFLDLLLFYPQNQDKDSIKMEETDIDENFYREYASELIEILKHYADGGDVERRSVSPLLRIEDAWFRLEPGDTWDFGAYEYRKAPRTWTAVVNSDYIRTPSHPELQNIPGGVEVSLVITEILK
jgi:hypothetical protein